MTGFDEFKTPYAFVKLYGDRNYGHIEVIIRNIAFSDSIWRSPLIRVTCQIGTSDWGGLAMESQCEAPYAWHHGIEGQSSAMTLSELEVSVKVMRRLEKKLDKMREELGIPETFSEYASRVIIASGVEVAFINDNFGGSYHCKLEDLPHRKLDHYGEKGKLRSDLAGIEADLISRYSRKQKLAA